MDDLQDLQQFCDAHGLPYDDRAARRFATYVELLEQFNAKMNLIGPFDRPEIVRQLLIDSVAPAALVPPHGRVLDIGTGAGLPGIPLKILYPDVPITLVEPRKKRSMFQKIVKTRLHLDDVEIVRERIEDTDLGPHDWVVSKAFRNPPDWARIATPLTTAGGHVVCLHASDTIAELDDTAVGLELVLAGRILDVRDELDVAVPAGRAISVFQRER